MLKRTITGACYLIVLAGFFLLRQLVNTELFNILIGLFCIIGTYEVAQSQKPKMIKGSYILAVIYGFLIVPLYVLGNHVLSTKFNGGWVLVVDLFCVALITISIMVMAMNVDSKVFWPSFLPFIYPSLFLLVMMLANDNPYGFIILLLSFVVSPASDTFAYLTGSLIGGPKLCPKLSPKKTWSGAIGGTIGGIVSAIVVWAILKPEINFFSPIFFFIIVGLVASIVNIFGDLFESHIKRKADIKDMGIILPGHGGIMDRIDGTLFTTVAIFIAFLFV